MIRNQGGQVLPLTIGFALIVFSVAGIAVDGARVFLLRRGLQNSADAAASSAASQLDADAFYAAGGTDGVLDRSSAVAEARRMLAVRGISSHSAITIEDDFVRAVVSARLRTSFLSLIGVDELRVVAEATAAPVFGDAP